METYIKYHIVPCQNKQSMKQTNLKKGLMRSALEAYCWCMCLFLCIVSTRCVLTCIRGCFSMLAKQHMHRCTCTRSTSIGEKAEVAFSFVSDLSVTWFATSDPACLWPVSGLLSACCDLGLYFGLCSLSSNLAPCCLPVYWPLLVSRHCLCLMLLPDCCWPQSVSDAVLAFRSSTLMPDCWWPLACVLAMRYAKEV